MEMDHGIHVVIIVISSVEIEYKQYEHAVFREFMILHIYRIFKFTEKKEKDTEIERQNLEKGRDTEARAREKARETGRVRCKKRAWSREKARDICEEREKR